MLKVGLMRRARVNIHTHQIDITPGILASWGSAREEQNFTMKVLIKGQQSTASQHRCAHLIRAGLFKRQILIAHYREGKKNRIKMTISDAVSHSTATPQLNKST